MDGNAGKSRGLVGKPATHLGQSSMNQFYWLQVTALDRTPGPDLTISLAVCHTFENLALDLLEMEKKHIASRDMKDWYHYYMLKKPQPQTQQ